MSAPPHHPTPLAEYALPTPQYLQTFTKSHLSNILHPTDEEPSVTPNEGPTEPEGDEDYPSANEERFIEMYGQEVWAAFRDAQTLICSDLSSGRQIGDKVVQVTISLMVPSDDGDDTARSQTFIEVVSAPEEGGNGSWETRMYSIVLDDMSSADTNNIIYSLNRLHRNIKKYGFSINEAVSSTDGRIELEETLSIHNGKSNHRPPTLPLTLSRADCEADAPPMLSVAYHQYLVKQSNEKLWNTWNAQREEESRQEAIDRVQKPTLRQMADELDSKAADFRDNVNRFKARHEENCQMR